MILWEMLTKITIALISLLFITYIGYYLYILLELKLKSNNKSKPQTNLNFKPRITLIVPTYNDATTIYDKLLNLRDQTYPTSLMEIILIDSNSQDGTVDIAKKFALEHPEVDIKIIVEEVRRGKSASINTALSAVNPQSEIVVMTDANAFLSKNALEKLVSCFSSPTIGAVVGKQIIPITDKTEIASSEMNYLRFYQKIREGESVIDSTPIFDGELSAYRTNVIKNQRVREDLNADDSQLAVMVRRNGYKAIMEPEAIFYEALPANWDMLRRQKVRRGQGLSRLFWYNKDMLFKPAYGKFSCIILPMNFFMYVVSPFILLSVLTLAILSFSIYILYGENPTLPLLLISIALLGLLIEKFAPTKTKIYKLCLTFVKYQFILLEGMLLFLTGTSLHKWQKVERKTRRD